MHQPEQVSAHGTSASARQLRGTVDLDRESSWGPGQGYEAEEILVKPFPVRPFPQTSRRTRRKLRRLWAAAAIFFGEKSHVLVLEKKYVHSSTTSPPCRPQFSSGGWLGDIQDASQSHRLSHSRRSFRNGIQEKKRSFHCGGGPTEPKMSIVHLHYIMSSVDIKAEQILFCGPYKKEPSGLHVTPEEERSPRLGRKSSEAFETRTPKTRSNSFRDAAQYPICLLQKKRKRSWATHMACVSLQDFEAVTPNLLARTVETVEGGGLVLLLLKGMKSLKQLYTQCPWTSTRDIAQRHMMMSWQDSTRGFILSLGQTVSPCLVVDDELNVLPISGGKNVQPFAASGHRGRSLLVRSRRKLKEIKDSLG